MFIKYSKPVSITKAFFLKVYLSSAGDELDKDGRRGANMEVFTRLISFLS